MNFIASALVGVLMYVAFSALNQVRIYYTRANTAIFTAEGYKKTLFGWKKPAKTTDP